MTLPIAISIPHAGLRVPEEAVPYCQLTQEQILKDGDEGAIEIYDLRDEVAEYLVADVARAIVDLNRTVDDRRRDGVVKTHTIWNEPIYRQPLPEAVVDQLLERYYQPYHARLSDMSRHGLRFAVDCHTMASKAPPIQEDAGTKRPEICLGNVHGQSFPDSWTTILQRCLQETFSGFTVTVNDPFAGGHITKTHGSEMPWIQIEVSRSEFLPKSEIRTRILRVLQETCQSLPT